MIPWPIARARPWLRGLASTVSRYLKKRSKSRVSVHSFTRVAKGNWQTKVRRTIGFPSGLGLDRYRNETEGRFRNQYLGAYTNPPLRTISLRPPTVVVSRLMSRRTRLRSVRNSKDFTTRTVMMADVLGRAWFVSVSSKPEDMMAAKWYMTLELLSSFIPICGAIGPEHHPL